jgi:hypothetical protein
MGVSGQRHAPAALYPRGKDPGTHCTGGWVGPRAGLDTEARGKILCPCRGSNPDRPIVQTVVRHYTDWATRGHVTSVKSDLMIKNSWHFRVLYMCILQMYCLSHVTSSDVSASVLTRRLAWCFHYGYYYTGVMCESFSNRERKASQPRNEACVLFITHSHVFSCVTLIKVREQKK